MPCFTWRERQHQQHVASSKVRAAAAEAAAVAAEAAAAAAVRAIGRRRARAPPRWENMIHDEVRTVLCVGFGDDARGAAATRCGSGAAERRGFLWGLFAQIFPSMGVP